MIRLWSDWVKDKKNNGKSLPVIVPLVFYHGKSRWTIPTNFASIFGDIPEIMRPYIPDFSYELADLGQVADKDLSKDKRLAALLTPMKYIFKTDIMVSLKESENGLLELDKVDIVTWMAYILNVRNDIDREDIASVMNHLPAPQREEIMAGLAQEFREEWYQKGIAEGVAKAQTETRAKSLIEALESRLESIPETVKLKIKDADMKQLDKWFSKALKATSLEDVFDKKKH